MTVLSFDEMKVCSTYEYDRKNYEILGPHHYMQVVMARGLFSKWKQVIYVDFDAKMTKNVMENIVTRLQNVGYPVVAIVCDCGGSNIGLWRDLGINLENVYFINPVNGEKIFVFADAPHLLKLLRNWLLDTGFTLEDGTVINKLPLEALVKQTDTEVSSFYKVREKHLTCKKSERQNVTLAAQLLSHTTAVALKRYRPGPSSILAEHLADFVGLVNRWFDVFNSFSVETKQHGKRPYGFELEDQNEILNEAIRVFGSMRCNGKTTLQTFQKGIIMSCTSLKLLMEELRAKYSVKYILTHRLNQDVLENFFSQVNFLI